MERGLALGQLHSADIEVIIAVGLPGQQLLQAGQEEADRLCCLGVKVLHWVTGGTEDGVSGKRCPGGSVPAPAAARRGSGVLPHLAGAAGGC